MVALIKSASRLLADAAWRAILLIRSTQSVQVENVFLRRQLSLFKECGVQARRLDATTSTNAAVREDSRRVMCADPQDGWR
jgi:hypothetical protein